MDSKLLLQKICYKFIRAILDLEAFTNFAVLSTFNDQVSSRVHCYILYRGFGAAWCRVYSLNALGHLLGGKPHLAAMGQ